MTSALPLDIVKELSGLPPLSACTIKLLEIIGKEDRSLMDLAKVIEKDGPMSIRVLKVVNSAAFPTQREVVSVSHAVSYLGERLIMSLAINQTAGATLNQRLGGYDLEAGELWDRGLWIALASQQFNKFTQKKEDDRSFTSALLHDIGKIILSKFLEGSIPEAVKEMDEDQVKNYLALEMEFLDTSHCEVGTELGRQWKLPDPILNVIRFHHDPFEAPLEYRELCYSIYLSDLLSAVQGKENMATAFFDGIDPGYQTYFNLDESSIEKILTNTKDNYEKEKEIYAV